MVKTTYNKKTTKKWFVVAYVIMTSTNVSLDESEIKTRLICTFNGISK
jgi:hypothetical protein